MSVLSTSRSFWALPRYTGKLPQLPHRRVIGGIGDSVTAALQRPRPHAAASAAEIGPTFQTLVPRTAKIPSATIFHEPWWLSVASDGAYEEAVVVSDGAVIGRMPYLRSRKIGWQTALVMPTMTHVLGPSLVTDLPGAELTRSLRRFTICSELIAQLPKASHIWFALHRRMTDTLAFEAAGFTTGVRFTAEIAPDARDALWRQMRDKTRNVIRRAEESLTVEDIRDPAPFIDFYKDNLRRRSLNSNYDMRICGNLMAACLERGVGRLLMAVDTAGAPQSAIFTAWDHETEYYLMSTRAPDSGNGATSLLIWTALQDAATAGRVFDMDGIDTKTNRLLVTGFGGALKPRYTVSCSSTTFQVAQHIKAGFTART